MTAEPAFTDAELAFLRHTRFGELPARVAPDLLVETQETDPPHEDPEPQPRALYSGG